MPGINIIDGKGRGFAMAVDSEGHGIVDALTFPDIAHVAEVHGQTFTWSSGTYNAAANDTILLVKNTSTTRNLFITDIWMSADTEGRVFIHRPTSEVTPTGTAVTGVNTNGTSNNVADATAIRTETNNSPGDIFWAGELQAAQDPYHVQTRSAWIFGQNQSIAVDYVLEVNAVVDVTIMGYFE